MKKLTNQERANENQEITRIDKILTRIEFILRIAIPIVATIFVLIQIFKPDLLTTGTILKLILLIVASLSISEGISKFLSIDNIKEQLNDIHNQNIPEKINELKLSIDNLYDYEIPNQKLLESAFKSGIVEIEPRMSKNWLDELNNELAKSTGPIDICTIGMPSLITNNSVRNALIGRAEKHDIRVLLLDPYCEEADRRAKIEKALGRKTIADIRSTTDWLREKIAENCKFRVHLYQIPPILSLFITSNHVYMEPYHFGRPNGVEGCIGGHVPNLKIKNDPDNSSVFFKAHFEYLWRDTRGGRLNLTFNINEYEKGNYFKIINQNDFDIKMDGWVLAAHEVQKSLKFSPDFIWEKNQEVTIFLKKEKAGENEFVWNINSFDSRTIFTMQNEKNITVAQWSPEVIDESCI